MWGLTTIPINHKSAQKHNETCYYISFNQGPAIIPASSWARSLGGARLENEIIAEYFGGDSVDEADDGFYQPQKYHYTPTQRAQTSGTRKNKKILVEILLIGF